MVTVNPQNKKLTKNYIIKQLELHLVQRHYTLGKKQEFQVHIKIVIY